MPTAELRGVPGAERERGVIARQVKHLTRLVDALLMNASKYTGAGGSISIEAKRPDDIAVLKVRDSGVGIGEELLGRVFDRFVAEQQTLARAGGGLGLGLAIVKSLVTLPGGCVAAESEGVGRRSVFSVRLPALASALDEGTAAAVVESARVAGPHPRRRRHLVNR